MKYTMSMQIKIYKPATGDYDVVDCMKYDKFYKQHRKMKDKYGGSITVNVSIIKILDKKSSLLFSI